MHALVSWVIPSYLSLGFLMALLFVVQEAKVNGEITGLAVISAVLTIFLWPLDLLMAFSHVVLWRSK